MEIREVTEELLEKDIITFCNYYTKNREDFIKNIDMTSYLIKNISNEYSYNKTYLSSYIKDLDKLSSNIIKKDKVIKLLYRKITNNAVIKLIDDIIIRIDDFWILSSKGIEYDEFNYKDIISSEFYIEIILKQKNCILKTKEDRLVRDVENEIKRINTNNIL